ncbi:hypothetical protein JX265_013195 [Neoarthrinium moseri]|uniref:Uncharacterized protein n=1 Tax=Neoarthrinium moseri TaxID=1658444 RepID=A0A9P9W949_9PEZI|nr:uncharacterized protein JN550_011608 [Neoarthrinium moseri]KAI1840735.1 hypothetical protein JX266_013080 [Neoarthrinium moseri]KAI1851838.1 hypothetical protein JX265_013195 [Neoarthrinium moseri]KAI1860342.1 hypothetical protein JN550_011608 [Neoarthrinium moseri]
MPQLREISYSRDLTIAAVRDYYKFLVSMYVSESEVVQPPESGWPSITTDNFGALGKAAEALELLRHLPYILDRGNGTQPEAAPGAHFVDYRLESMADSLRQGGDEVESIRMKTDGADTWQQTPPHVIGLCSAPHGGYCFLLDTKAGIIYWVHCPAWVHENPSWEPVTEQVESPDQEEFRSSPAWAVEDFFELLKDQFRALVFLPTTEETVIETHQVVTDEEMDALPVVQGIYKKHGWPDLGTFQKDACLEVIEQYLEENCPELLQSS